MENSRLERCQQVLSTRAYIFKNVTKTVVFVIKIPTNFCMGAYRKYHTLRSLIYLCYQSRCEKDEIYCSNFFWRFLESKSAGVQSFSFGGFLESNSDFLQSPAKQ
jgi:hypothetical protein